MNRSIKPAAGPYCLRAPAQGACPYANICEHCPNFRTDAASITVLSAQRVDAEALAERVRRHEEQLRRLNRDRHTS